MGVGMIGKNIANPIIADKDFLPTVLTIVLAAVYFGFRRIVKKKMSPIVLILIAAFVGIAAYGF